MFRLVFALTLPLALVAVTHAAPARADLSTLAPSQGPARAPLSTPSRGGVDAEFASFDLAGHKGDFLTVAPLVDWSPSDGAALRLRVPVETLWLSGESARTGLGDIELRARFRLYQDGERLLAYGGIDEELPTGASHLGLGSGALQATPFITGGYKIDRVIFFATLGDAISLHPVGAKLPFDYIEPNTDHELHEDLGLIWNTHKKIHLGAVLNGVTVLTRDDFGRSLLTGDVNAVLTPSSRWKIAIVFAFPLAGEHRFEEKLAFSAYYYFG